MMVESLLYPPSTLPRDGREGHSANFVYVIDFPPPLGDFAFWLSRLSQPKIIPPENVDMPKAKRQTPAQKRAAEAKRPTPAQRSAAAAEEKQKALAKRIVERAAMAGQPMKDDPVESKVKHVIVSFPKWSMLNISSEARSKTSQDLIKKYRKDFGSASAADARSDLDSMRSDLDSMRMEPLRYAVAEAVEDEADFRRRQLAEIARGLDGESGPSFLSPEEDERLDVEHESYKAALTKYSEGLKQQQKMLAESMASLGLPPYPP
jgi:hypothetical protein